MTLIQFIGGIALLRWAFADEIAASNSIRRDHLKHRGDEYTDLNSIGGGDGFHHGGADK